MSTSRFPLNPFLSSGFTGIFVYIDDALTVAFLPDKHLEKTNLQQSVCLRAQKPNSKHGSTEVLAFLRVDSKDVDDAPIGSLTHTELTAAIRFSHHTLHRNRRLVGAFQNLQTSRKEWFLPISVKHDSTDLTTEALIHFG